MNVPGIVALKRFAVVQTGLVQASPAVRDRAAGGLDYIVSNAPPNSAQDLAEYALAPKHCQLNVRLIKGVRLNATKPCQLKLAPRNGGVAFARRKRAP